MGMGTGMAWWEWVGMKTQYFPIYCSQVADTVNGPFFLHSNLS